MGLSGSSSFLRTDSKTGRRKPTLDDGESDSFVAEVLQELLVLLRLSVVLRVDAFGVLAEVVVELVHAG